MSVWQLVDDVLLPLLVSLIRVKLNALSAAYMQLIGVDVAQWCVNQRSN